MAKHLQTQPSQWSKLEDQAWEVRENAHIHNRTKVGAAVLAEDGRVFTGCNVEHRFMSHPIHAEVNAIGAMAAAGEKKLEAILVVSDRTRFTPCGACMDWIIEFGGTECLVGYQSRRGGEVEVHRAGELMPYYPID